MKTSRLRIHAGLDELLEGAPQVLLGRHRAEEQCPLGEEVRVADVGDGVQRFGVLAELGHA